MNVRNVIVLAAGLAVGGVVLGQSQRIAYTQLNDDFDFFGAEPTGPDVGVSGLAALV